MKSITIPCLGYYKARSSDVHCMIQQNPLNPKPNSFISTFYKVLVYKCLGNPSAGWWTLLTVPFSFPPQAPVIDVCSSGHALTQAQTALAGATESLITEVLHNVTVKKQSYLFIIMNTQYSHVCIHRQKYLPSG